MLEALATEDNFDEDAYLRANPDVVDAVRAGGVDSGRAHFAAIGKDERRSLKYPPALIAEAKRRKRERIRPLLRADMPSVETQGCLDFLSPELRAQFDIVDTEAVSSNGYDGHAMALIDEYRDGLILDCGAGKRPVYFDNVVNFEIVDYDTTDVRGVGEVLPFADDSFDAVLSIAVLEHVKDPFQCAREIARVLKPGGRLMCCVPFLQPQHGYPHHYYNMTAQGLRNLFADHLIVGRGQVYDSILPIWSLTWILRSWAEGLLGETRQDFLDLRIGDLLEDPAHYLQQPFVTELSADKNQELASATVIFARKRYGSRD
ncbi:hypothetical protein D779_0734 [Imhoffiella purpurea]|uniref:Methyltransferase type 11 domain-containing protein n=1 Tax=Imhoffiella purpurea TaxID=1249627 RepID=W9VG65_9GAMM|nr:hypothetical protein D779_0734 [Imhoffiella purpurea]